MEVNNVNIYGYQIKPITADDEFKIIDKLIKFKRGTIENSYYDNELALIPDTNLGVYKAYGGEYMICEVEKIVKMVETFGLPQYKEKEFYKPSHIRRLKDFVKEHEEEADSWILSNVDHDKYVEEMNNLIDQRLKDYNYYYDIDFTGEDHNGKFSDIAKIYLENQQANEYISIDLAADGSVIETDHLIFDMQKEISMLRVILNYILINKNIFSNIQELDNGYVFNNTYYEDINDILDDIENVVRNNKLYDKFMNEGLTLEDISGGTNNG